MTVPSDMVAASVVIAARNAEATIERTLAALRAQDREDWEAVVVDDGSTDSTARLVGRAAELDSRIRLVSQSGMGAAGARNRGAAEATGDVLAFTDADCFPTPGWLSAGVEAMRRAQLVQGAVGPDPAATTGPFDRTLWVDPAVGLYETANLFMARAAFERVGGFEEWLHAEGRPMGEDVWLGWRIRRAGASFAPCPEAVVHHAVFARSAGEYVAERRRLAQFPAIVDRIPELRGTLCFGRVFLSRRTAALDAAVAGAAAALVTRSLLPLAAALPYAAGLVRHAARFRSSAPKVAATDLVADAVGLVALVRGSVAARTPLL